MLSMAYTSRTNGVKMKVLSLTVLAVLLANVNGQTSADQRRNAVDNSAKILTDLYVTLRNIAFPKSPLSNDVAYNRFILVSPGRVLNYWDYYPGAEYEESLANRNNSDTEALVPPSVMEKWFDIADVTVGPDPFTGGVTGKSFARTYETILAGMDVPGFAAKTSEAKARYNVAHTFLTSVIPDPENVTQDVTRLSLYERFKDQYAQARLNMEEAIENARTTRGSLSYQLWFQRNFPSMNSRVESAYTKWLTFGEKEVVELYKVYLDSGASSANLAGARMSLRASGLQSLDRTRTVYPVSFEPGNWYRYLLPKKTKYTRDMLLVQKGLLESERDALEAIVAYNTTQDPDAQAASEALEASLNSSTMMRDNKTNTAVALMMKCMKENSEESTEDGSSNCDKLREANADALDAIFEQGQAKSRYESAAVLLKTKEEYDAYLRARLATLSNEIKNIEGKLSGATPYLGEIVESRELESLNKSVDEQNLDDAWTQFEYDSQSSHQESERTGTSVQTTFGVGGFVGGGGFAVGLTQTTEKSDYEEALSEADVTVSGELLRVVIKRPWFRPSLFEDSSLSFVKRDETKQKNTYVSPGPLTEAQLVKAIGGTADNLYLMSEYVGSFLLARNVNLEFHGVDQKHVSSALRVFTGLHVTGSYNGIGLHASVGVGRTQERMVADRTTNGLRITIPGAQIMGYYTNVLPQFPRTQL